MSDQIYTAQALEIAKMAEHINKLKELALKNLYIALSERDALRAHDIDPDGGTYMAALDDEIATAKDRMRELGIEVD